MNSGGICIFDTAKELIRQYSLLEMSRWGYKVDILFYMEIRPLGEAPSTIEFDTVEGLQIADLLTDYAKEFMAEKARMDARIAQASAVPATPAASAHTASKPAGAPPTAPPAAAPKAPVPPPVPATAPPGPPRAPPPPGAVRPAVEKRGSSVKDIMAANALKAKHNKAATRIQALYRGYALRSEWSKEGAIILIQAIVRGYLQRVRLAKMIEEMFASGEFSMDG